MEIRIENLRLRTIIGVKPRERLRRREVRVSLAIFIGARRAARTDSIDDTVDYAALADRIRREAEKSRFRLLEALAEHVLQVVLSWPKVRRAEVEVAKPGALGRCESVSVRACGRRERSQT